MWPLEAVGGFSPCLFKIQRYNNGTGHILDHAPGTVDVTRGQHKDGKSEGRPRGGGATRVLRILNMCE